MTSQLVKGQNSPLSLERNITDSSHRDDSPTAGALSVRRHVTDCQSLQWRSCVCTWELLSNAVFVTQT